MNKNRVLNINIPSPCAENWDNMLPKENGRFCSNCKKTIIDFSALTNQELYSFFKTHPGTSCGRFRNDQLNTDIIELKHKKSFLKNIYKIAAAFATLFLFKYSSASVSGKKGNIITAYSPEKKQPVAGDAEDIVITGTVKDAHGNKLENAEVRFGDSIIVKTDAEGNFKIEVSDEREIKATLLQISFPGLITVARSYHPAMLSTSYEVILSEPKKMHSIIMGGITDPSENIHPITISCNGSSTLTNDIKITLAVLAIDLRNNPEAAIVILAFPGKKKTLSNSMKMLPLVKKYLIEMEGISPERIKTSIIPDAPDAQNMLEINPSPSSY